MKVLIFVHELVVGGTSVNAIELAATLRDLHDFDVVLFATPGPMATLAMEKGVRFLPAPVAPWHPAPARMKALRQAVRRERPDVIHVWETWACIDAYYSVHLPMRIPMVLTDMQMAVHRVLPKNLFTTFGTPKLVDEARASGRRRVEVLVPPVDVHLNAPNAVSSVSFRQRYGVTANDILLVTVSRLAQSMKAESVFRTIDVVRHLGRDLPLRLIIVGDGDVRSVVEQLAQEVNTELARPAVLLAGVLVDPRPAYAAADIVVGMGSSALRGMAFGKPVVVVGEQGFSAPFTPETAEAFYYQGMYGTGDGSSTNTRLAADIAGLANRLDQLQDLGGFSREFVAHNFSLEATAARLAEYLEAATVDVPRVQVLIRDGVRTAAVYLRERRFLWRATPG